jgi:hypothetical protein
MDSSQLLAALGRDLEVIRAEYVSSGRGDEFDAHVNRLRADGRWPFHSRRWAQGHSRTGSPSHPA